MNSLDALKKSNRCMEAVLAFLEKNAARLRKEFPDGALLGVFIGNSHSEHIKLLTFKSEEEAVNYKSDRLPEALREGAVVVPVSANVALML